MNSQGAIHSSGSTFARIRACALSRKAFKPTTVSVVDRVAVPDKIPKYVSLRDFSDRMGLPIVYLRNLTDRVALNHCLVDGQIFINYEKGVRDLEALESGPTTTYSRSHNASSKPL